MKKSLKIFAIVMMALVMIFTATSFVFADSAGHGYSRGQ